MGYSLLRHIKKRLCLDIFCCCVMTASDIVICCTAYMYSFKISFRDIKAGNFKSARIYQYPILDYAHPFSNTAPECINLSHWQNWSPRHKELLQYHTMLLFCFSRFSHKRLSCLWCLNHHGWTACTLREQLKEAQREPRTPNQLLSLCSIWFLADDTELAQLLHFDNIYHDKRLLRRPEI